MKTQLIPSSLLNTTWKLLHSTDDQNPCYLSLTFKEKGKLIMTFKDHFFDGTYIVKGNSLDLFVGFIPKIVWTSDSECKTNPSNFSMYMNGDDISFTISGNEMVLTTTEKRFIFKKE